ncbi:microsomal glutathione S-transferase [Thecamonas trahens ATCC 50062]|uniref:Microsomal glutathione S-transferase n=1 Tax=Thecamonas trahens ATCC 50062 TaxID=461836 RepID=A0A0L0DH37_THETB|nr:microsomal glutathione S-transferase [Thecamonas trahens ATCC 50062]KNC50618.1 microsomal glutathione S-transferase [Thecamonas trahens ATCC 50062]|eukprot:XP_013762505.1 microsomal glutathione S-transferase [Thecamonas trahens ATCC 50062]
MTKTAKPQSGKNPMGIVSVVMLNLPFPAVMLAVDALGYMATAEAALQGLVPGGQLTSLAAFGMGAIAFHLLNGWLGACVNGARAAYDVPWPHAYAPTDNKHKILFDSTQRAHQNTVEGAVPLLVSFLLASRSYPAIALLCFLTFIASRIPFALGYMSGIVSRKDSGVFGYPLGKMPLFGLAVVTVVDAVVHGTDW